MVKPIQVSWIFIIFAATVIKVIDYEKNRIIFIRAVAGKLWSAAPKTQRVCQ
jgi:hypothetical protein